MSELGSSVLRGFVSVEALHAGVDHSRTCLTRCATLTHASLAYDAPTLRGRNQLVRHLKRERLLARSCARRVNLRLQIDLDGIATELEER